MSRKNKLGVHVVFSLQPRLILALSFRSNIDKSVIKNSDFILNIGLTDSTTSVLPSRTTSAAIDEHDTLGQCTVRNRVYCQCCNGSVRKKSTFLFIIWLDSFRRKPSKSGLASTSSSSSAITFVILPIALAGLGFVSTAVFPYLKGIA